MRGFFRDGEDDAPPKALPSQVRLLHGDAFDELARMDDGCVDVVITDPPYSEHTHEGARTTESGRSFRDGRKAVKLLTFESITDGQFVDFARHAVRVARRWVVTFCDWRHVGLLEPAGLPLVRFGVWVKPSSAPQLSGDRPATGWEAVAILHRPGRKRWNGGGSKAVWVCNSVSGKRHPTEKPLRLVRDLVRLFSDPGEVVLDPFAGSCTTGVACLQTGRYFLGIEKDAGFYKTSLKRLARRR